MSHRTLNIDMEEVISSIDSMGDDPFVHYLDVQTGRIVDVTNRESMYYLASDEEDPDEDAGREIEENPERYKAIPSIESRDDYDLMCRFADTIDEDDIRDKLAIALNGRGAFSRFRDVVFSYPDLKEQWFSLRRQALLDMALDWFEALEIEPKYELRQPERPQPAAAPKPTEPGLLDVLLLGLDSRGNQLVDNRIVRRIQAREPGQANRLFKKLARELCGFWGVEWRNRYTKGKRDFDMGRTHLTVRGNVVELSTDVDEDVLRAFDLRTGE